VAPKKNPSSTSFSRAACSQRKRNIQRSLLEKNKGLSTPTNNSSNVISHLESTSKFHQGNSAIRYKREEWNP
jgi:hypothetical protein